MYSPDEIRNIRAELANESYEDETDIGPVRPNRPFYAHTSLLSGSVYMSDLLFSPAASEAISGNSDMTDNSGYYDNWEEPEVPGSHFTYGDESDIPNCSCNWDCSCEYWAGVANGTPAREH